MGLSLRNFTEAHYQRLYPLMMWGAPIIAVPALRYLNDPPETRRQLFIRDFSTYALGGATYALGFAAAYGLTKKLFPHVQTPVRKLAGMLTGLIGNWLYAGIGAVRLSQWLHQDSPVLVKPPTPLLSQHFAAASSYNPFQQLPMASSVPYPMQRIS